MRILPNGELPEKGESKFNALKNNLADQIGAYSVGIFKKIISKLSSLAPNDSAVDRGFSRGGGIFSRSKKLVFQAPPNYDKTPF